MHDTLCVAEGGGPRGWEVSFSLSDFLPSVISRVVGLAFPAEGGMIRFGMCRIRMRAAWIVFPGGRTN